MNVRHQPADRVLHEQKRTMSQWNTFAVVPYCKHLVTGQTLVYAAPIKMPTASTMAPPSTIWNTACSNGVSMYRARI
jgi:hypothetical protein